MMDSVFIGVSDFDIGYDLLAGEKVCCGYCQRDGDHTQYGKGEAVLTSPGYAYDLNNDANYVCMRHLGFRRFTIYDVAEDVWRTWLGALY